MPMRTPSGIPATDAAGFPALERPCRRCRYIPDRPRGISLGDARRAIDSDGVRLPLRPPAHGNRSLRIPSPRRNADPGRTCTAAARSTDYADSSPSLPSDRSTSLSSRGLSGKDRSLDRLCGRSGSPTTRGWDGAARTTDMDNRPDHLPSWPAPCYPGLVPHQVPGRAPPKHSGPTRPLPGLPRLWTS